jgi:16S rRNA (guanine966-N2)-methyltransferase
MRVIAGTYRSRPLIAPKGDQTRPTSDRLRETLFNILSPRLEGCRFVDLYAGTGAVGIEAISRGAAHVWLVERAEPPLAAIRANLRSLKIAGGYSVEERSATAVLERLAKSTQSPQLNIVYLDPPWDAEAEYTNTLQFLGSTRGVGILAPGALVVAEHNSKSALNPRYGSLLQTRTLKQGDAGLSFFAVAEKAEDQG